MDKFERLCPKCGKTIYYTLKGNCAKAEKFGRSCLSCGQKHSAYQGSEKKKQATAKTDKSIYKTEEFRKRISSLTKGNKNPRFGGKTNYELWVEKYGVDEADIRLKAMKEKQSLNNSGTNNNMYGKPTPKGAGNGWSGWYKEWYFRSLRELSYMINVIEKERLEWITGEKFVRIPYICPLGKTKTYSPDFLINNKILVEIKPLKLHITPLVQAKAKAAIEYCNKNRLEYQLIDAETLSLEEISELRKSGKIKFLDRYEQKYKEKYETV